MVEFAFEGQHAVVTGGTRGIGRAISEAFLRRGARVTACYAGDEGAARRMQTELDVGAWLTVVRCDVADYEQVKILFEGLSAPPTILVNNAGIRRDSIVGMLKPEDLRRTLAVNLEGSFYCSKFAVQAMSRAKYGRIINISSPSAELGIAGQAAYAASKAGQIALARALAKEVATRKITVNCVEPGFVETELLGDLDAEAKEAYRKLVPQGRFGSTEEIASAVLFLAAREASYITGTTLRVAGGL